MRKGAIEKALEKLPTIEQVICGYLEEGYSIEDIAKIMNMHRKAIEYRIRKIRRLFEKQGLKGEL